MRNLDGQNEAQHPETGAPDQSVLFRTIGVDDDGRSRTGRLLVPRHGRGSRMAMMVDEDALELEDTARVNFPSVSGPKEAVCDAG